MFENKHAFRSVSGKGLSPQDWDLLLLPFDLGYQQQSESFDLVYNAWKETWKPVFQNMQEGTQLYSDAYTRQHERLALFYRGECAGMGFFYKADLSRVHHRDDSYFSWWPEEALASLTQNGSHVLVCSNFTVIDKFRNVDMEFKVKDLLMGALVRYFLASPFIKMAGNARNLKGVNDLTYKWGAVPIMKNVKVYGEESDLVAWYQSTAKRDANPLLSPLLDSLWERRQPEGLKQSKAA